MPKKQQYRLFYIALMALFIIFFYKGCVSKSDMSNKNTNQASFQVSISDNFDTDMVLSKNKGERNNCSFVEYERLAQSAEKIAEEFYKNKDGRYTEYKQKLVAIAQELKADPSNLLSACQKLDDLLSE